MKFSSLPDGADGRLLLVSRDLRYAVDAAPIAPTLLDALQRWDAVAPLLAARYDALNAGALPDARPFDPQACAAPLPRSPQWCDGSAFLNHGRLMEQAFNTPPISEFDTVPGVPLISVHFSGVGRSSRDRAWRSAPKIILSRINHFLMDR